ncbi:MAG TPA: hypothetical protein VEI52_08910 [Terriglobales bacterium]|nr:hypothetical protein [Terriglobales bacterium]
MALFIGHWNRDTLIPSFVFIVGLGYMAYRYFHDRLRSEVARSWPLAEATIQSAAVGVSVNGTKPKETESSILSIGVNTHLQGDGLLEPRSELRPIITWVVHIGYSFSVGGMRYGGYSDRGVSSERAGAEYARGLPGKRFRVRYKPGDPEKSVVLDAEWIADIPSESEGARDPFWE